MKHTPSTKNPKLEAILIKASATYMDEDEYKLFITDQGLEPSLSIREATQQIQAALDWIIGEDETPTAAYSQPGMYEINERNKQNAIRNHLRAEQRKRLNQFCGKEQG